MALMLICHAGQDCRRRIARGRLRGKRAFMDLLAPLGPVYQAGTLSGNPLAYGRGIATVSYLQEHAAQVTRSLKPRPKPSPRAWPPKPPAQAFRSPSTA